MRHETNCSLGLDCTAMGLLADGECINEDNCYRYTEPSDLYGIVLLKGIPGAVYLLYPRTNYEWTDEKWGFKYLNNCDWLLHCTASLNCFAEWQHAYYKLSNRRNSKYVRADLWQEFDELRKQTDAEYRHHQETDSLLIF